MLDFLSFPNQQDGVTYFYGNGGAWQTWRKPRNCDFVYILCIGGGAGGNGGSTTQGAIQSGSASGGVTKALFNASVLPDILYVQVGLGGAGATTSGGIGSPGTRSIVSISPVISAQNFYCISGNAAATASVGETLATTVGAFLLALSNFTSTAGLAPPGSVLNGNITGSGTQGGSYTLPSTATNGTNISGTTFSQPQLGGIGGATGTNGTNGTTCWNPLFGTGGTGGGASFSGVGGRGGDGGLGSGGGAGGGGSAGGGAGGKGGDGLVIIATF